MAKNVFKGASLKSGAIAVSPCGLGDVPRSWISLSADSERLSLSHTKSKLTFSLSGKANVWADVIRLDGDVLSLAKGEAATFRCTVAADGLSGVASFNAYPAALGGSDAVPIGDLPMEISVSDLTAEEDVTSPYWFVIEYKPGAQLAGQITVSDINVEKL